MKLEFNELYDNKGLNETLNLFIEGSRSLQQLLFEFNNISHTSSTPIEMIIYDNSNTMMLSTSSNSSVGNSYVLSMMLDKELEELKILRISNSLSYLVTIYELENGKVVFLSPNSSFSSGVGLTPANYAVTSNNFTTFSISDSQFIEGYLDKIDNRLLDSSSVIDGDQYVSTNDNYNDHIVVFSFLKQGNLTIPLLSVTGLILIVGLILLISFFFISRRVVSISSESVNELAYKMKELGQGNRQRLDIESDDEIETIASQIDELIETLNESHRDNLDLIKIAHQFELKQLIATFNPHFIYNTLETIRSTMYYDVELSSGLMQWLTKVLRYSLEEQTVVTLNNDIEYIQYYLKIHKVRHGDRFNYSIVNELENSDVLIPKLLIQPLIENAIKYSFKSQKPLNLLIKFSEVNNKIHISASDDGPGISDEEINVTKKPSTHGIYNSRRRLELFDSESSFIITRLDK
ncbi:MAG: histidine kinase, partial [Erysipelothrix sp.]|nr:histidine kinase [Erysipelothrix sp.]